MRAAIYCRLSREDDEKQQESESILNQRAMLTQYAAEQGWEIYRVYCDEDYSGMDRERPAFRQLLEDARTHRFDLVLCKTQSRFTRDLELVEKYLHGKFVEWGIRFVAPVDHVDTGIRGNKKARQINGLINEWYLEDLSENIRAVLDSKRQRGEYIGGFALYGYQKDPRNKNKLLVEPGAAAVVKMIFAKYLAGQGTQSIAAELNRRGIPNPTRYKQQQGLAYQNGFAARDAGLWSRTTVSRILHNQMYVGDLVQGRTRKLSYKSAVTVPVPPEEWVVCPHTHEAIIARETFDTAQRMLQARTTSDGSGRIHPLAGKVFCADCGSAMQRVSSSYRGERHSYLRCPLHSACKACCSSHSIRLDLLEQEILVRLQRGICAYFDEAVLPKLILSAKSVPVQALPGEKQELRRKLALREKALQNLYLDKTEGLIGTADFEKLYAGITAERGQLMAHIALLEEQQTTESPQSSDEDKISLLQKLSALPELNRELIALFLHRVEISDKDAVTGQQRVHILWDI